MLSNKIVNGRQVMWEVKIANADIRTQYVKLATLLKQTNTELCSVVYVQVCNACVVEEFNEEIPGQIQLMT